MKKNLTTKVLFIVAVILACLYGIFGLPTSKEQLEANVRKNIQLGLDLRGGSHMVLRVEAQDAFKAEAVQTMDRIKADMAKNGITFSTIDMNDPKTLQDADKIEITVKGVPIDKGAEFTKLIDDRDADWVATSVDPTTYRLNMRQSAALALRKRTVEQSILTIENRINGLGLAENSVQQRGQAEKDSEILIQLPGVDDPARIRNILQTEALLEITSVTGGPYASPEAFMAQAGGVMPPGSKLIQYPARAGSGGDNGYYLVGRIPVVTGRDLRNAQPSRDPLTNKFETRFSLGQEGAARFEKYTGDNIGQKLAILLDDKAYSIATINGKIGDSGVITGQRTEQESSDLSLVLRAGSLPARVTALEERTVGPSLGADSIQQGMIAGLVGLVAVILAMLVYYKKSGINATLALILNAVILVAALSYFHAVLTLPGIAGIILTIGMAVDSNVLIFERIREELRAGKSVLTAVDNGFSKAFGTIIDTHITTIVSCAFLFIFGNAQVKGFAVTLVIGLIANLFTAVFVSKTIFDWELSGTSTKQPARISI